LPKSAFGRFPARELTASVTFTPVGGQALTFSERFSLG